MLEPHDLTIEALAHTIGPLVDEDPDDIAPDDNLFELGLDSIGLMQIVSGWRQAGADVTFADLAAVPTLEAWAELLATAAAATPSGPVGDAADGLGAGVAEPFDLAVMQRAYWVGRDRAQPLGGVSAHLYTEFDGQGEASVDPERLRAALDRAIGRHDTLRLVVTDDGRQRVAPTAGWRGLEVHDLRDLDAGEADARLAELRHERSHQMLDIEAGEVLSAALSLLPDGSTRFHLDIDMVAADALSYRLLLAELAATYAEPDLELAPLGTTFRAYCAARPAARQATKETARRWWQDRLPDLPGGPELPLVDEAPEGPPRVARRSLVLDPDRRNVLLAAARARGITPAVALATVFAEVVGTWSAEPRFLLNVPLFDRAAVHPDIDRVVGDFSSSVMLAVDLTAPATVAERAAAIQARLHEDAAYADHSGVEVLRDLTRHHGRQMLAPVVFTSALSLGELFAPEVRRRFGDPVWIVSPGPQVLLDAQVTELDGGLLVNWDTREEQFVPGVLDEMFAAFERLVADLAADGPAWDRPASASLPSVDRPRRRAAEAVTVPKDHVAPRSALERVVAGVWARVLGCAEPGIDDELFSLGGDSVLAAAIVTELRDQLDTDAVSIRSIFAAPTVAGLAARMLADEADPARLEEAAEIVLEIEAMSDDEIAAAIGEGA